MDEFTNGDFLAEQIDWLPRLDWMFEPGTNQTDMNFAFEEGDEGSLAYYSVENLDFNMLQMDMVWQNMKQTESRAHLLQQVPTEPRLSGGAYDPVSSTIAGTRKRAVRFTKLQIETLKSWFDQHIHNPYPNGKEIKDLVRETGLEARQIRIWLSKVRARQRKAQATSHSTRTLSTSILIPMARGVQTEHDLSFDTSRLLKNHSQSQNLTSESVANSSLDNLPASPHPRPISPDSDSSNLHTTALQLNELSGTVSLRKADQDPILVWWLETLPSRLDGFEEAEINPTLDKNSETTDNGLGTMHKDYSGVEGAQKFINSRTDGSSFSSDQPRPQYDDESLFRSDLTSEFGSLSSRTLVGSSEQGELSSEVRRNIAIQGAKPSKQNQVQATPRVGRSSGKIGKTYASSVNSVSSRASSCSYEAFGPRRGRRGPRNLENNGMLSLALRTRESGAQSVKISRKPDIVPKGLNTQELEITGNPLKGASCQVCTSRKIKCDRTRPRCGQCERLGQDCKFIVYQCTFCPMSFASRWMWVRHEESTHVAPYVWVCRQPVRNHHAVHFFGGRLDECWERPSKDRQFTRKDGLRQHLLQVHQFHSAMHGYDLDEHRQTQNLSAEQLSCPICRFQSGTWTERTNHVARHFEAGEALPRKSTVAL